MITEKTIDVQRQHLPEGIIRTSVNVRVRGDDGLKCLHDTTLNCLRDSLPPVPTGWRRHRSDVNMTSDLGGKECRLRAEFEDREVTHGG